MKRFILSAMLMACVTVSHAADAFPSRTIRLVVTTAAGGGSDTLGRLLMQKLSETMGVTTLVENKPGAGGAIATKEVLRAEPDGYTLLLATSSTHGINPWFYADLGYDAVKDFSVISIIAKTDYALAVRADSPVKKVGDLVEMAKSKPVDFSSSGNGTTTHLAGALLTTESKGEFTHVPYRAAPQSLNGLLAGEVTFMFENTSLFLPFVQSGKLRLIATTGGQRSPVAPDVPTLKESGFPDYEIVGWFALLAPAKLPAPIQDRLNQEIVKILAMPEVKQRLAQLGYAPSPTTPAEGSAFVESQLEKFGGIFKQAGIQAQ